MHFFLLKYFTLSAILIAPNLAGGLTAVKVTNLFFLWYDNTFLKFIVDRLSRKKP